jgi:hypothetical protein
MGEGSDMAECDEFAEEYQDRIDDLLGAQHRNFSLRLSDWLDLLDESRFSKRIVQSLEAHVDFREWYNVALTTRGSMVGSGTLDWSRDRTERLGQQLGLMRFLAKEEMAFVSFTSDFLWGGKKLDDNVDLLNDQIIRPFARDLLKHIQKSQAGQVEVPATDRVVALDHNSAGMVELDCRLAEVESKLTESNSVTLEEGYSRNLAEISAARRLFQATSVRVQPVIDLLVPALKWVGSKVADGAISAAITAILILLATVIGVSVPGLG